MKKALHLLVFVVALATAFALAQTSGTSNPSTPTSDTTAGQSTTGQSSTATTPASQDQDHDRGKNTKHAKANVDDSTLDQQIKTQLASDASLHDVQASVSNGVVDLSGNVPSKAERKRAKQLVAAVPGVRKVHDHLKVSASAGTAMPSNEPANAGVTGTTSQSETSSNTAGSISGNASAAGTQSGTSSNPPSSSTSGAAETQSSTSANTSQSGTSASGSVNAPQSSSTGSEGVSGNAGTSTSSTGMSGQAGATTGAMSGQTGTTAGTMSGQAGTTAAGTTGAMSSDSDLQSEIEKALQNEPSLANDHISANVSADTIQLSGTVATGKERQTALRIAQSYAGNHRVVDRLTVTGRGEGANMGNPNPQSGTGEGIPPSAAPNSPSSNNPSSNQPQTNPR